MADLDRLATPDYRALLRDRYTRKGWGGSGKSHAPVVAAYAKELGARTVLDYGCGRGTLKAAVPELDVREYDPGIIGKDGMPDPADLVVCTDVLEHIEPALLGNVLEHIRRLSLRGAYFIIALSKAKEILGDGRNAHLIIESPAWWVARLVEHDFAVSKMAHVKGLAVWAR